MKTLWQRIGFMGWLLFAGCWLPVQANNLSRTQVLVPMDVSQAQLRQARTDAWQQVLVRITGRQLLSSLDQPGDIQDYIIGTGFELSTEQLQDALGEALASQYYVIQFDTAKIIEFLRSQGQPYWPLSRPETLIWLQNGEQMMSDSDRGAMAQAAREQALVRGLALQLPLWDIVEQFELAPLDLANAESEVLLGLSERYGADWVYSAQLRQQAGEAVVQWQGLRGGESFTSQAPTAERAVRQGLDAIADAQARQFQVSARGGLMGVQVWDISGVGSYAAFAGLMNYLNAHSAIENLQLLEVQADRVRVQFSSNVMATVLGSQLAIERRLRPVDEQALVPSWRWQP